MNYNTQQLFEQLSTERRHLDIARIALKRKEAELKQPAPILNGLFDIPTDTRQMLVALEGIQQEVAVLERTIEYLLIKINQSHQEKQPVLFNVPETHQHSILI